MPHDLAATRRARKALRSATSPEPRAPETAEPATVAPVIGERVVADVRHEIGNYFHKLYYWADFLNESRSGRAGDVTATQMLEDTIHGLEALLKATLEYVRPVVAAPIRMQAREVADGMVRQLASALSGRAVAAVVDGQLSAERTLLVDPGRLSQLVAALVRRVEITTDAARELVVRVALVSREAGDVLALSVAADGSGTAHPTLAEVEWATAENIARVIGGELTVNEASGRTALVLTLPLRS
jgi:hypothetical protein